jgi:hypothetical protein
MELVEAEGDVGVVVVQEPAGGSLVARSALVTLFIAAPAGREGAAAAAGDSTRSENAAEQQMPEPEAEGHEPVVARCSEADGGTGGEVALGDDVAFGAVQDLGTAGSSEESNAGGELPAGRGLVGGGEIVAHAARRRRLVRVRWLLVVGGWRVWWVEGVAAGALALLADWATAGTRALAGAVAAAGVLLVLMAWAAIAASRQAAAQARRVGGVAEADRSERMLVDLDRQGGLGDGRADENG